MRRSMAAETTSEKTAQGKAVLSPVVPQIDDRLGDSFPLLEGESEWLMGLMADDLARILADD